MNYWIMPDLKKHDKSSYGLQIKICSHLGIPIEDVRSNSRKAEIAECRKVVTYFLRKRNKMRHQDVANFMGYKHHSSVIHAVKSIDGIAQFDVELRTKLAELTELLR